MKLFVGAAAVLGSLNAASGHRHFARQASSISRSFTGAPYPTGPGFDVPALADITRSSTPEPTVPLPVVFPPGSTPLPLGRGASGLPDLSSFDPSIYPPLDRIPPTNSPEVRAWLAEIAGATIPNLKPTVDGTCDSDPEAAADAGADGRCWWTCTGCTRDTDVVGCADQERWGLTFDDGPSEYTPKLLTFLQSIDTVATFYEVGSRVISHPETVQTQLMLGHELSVHTWSHTSMTTLTNEQVVAELGWTRKAIKDVTGVTPLTFRPPFGDMDDRIRAIANAMNLTPVVWTNVGTGKADTHDFEVPSGVSTAPQTVNQFRNTLAVVEDTFDIGIITLEHDLFQETVDLAIGSTLPDALSRPGPEQRGWKLGTVAQCRGQPAGDAYQETTTNQTVLARLGRAPTDGSTSSSVTISVSSTIQTTSPLETRIPGTSISVPNGSSEGTTSTVRPSNSADVTSTAVVPPHTSRSMSMGTTTTTVMPLYPGVYSPIAPPPAYETSAVAQEPIGTVTVPAQLNDSADPVPSAPLPAQASTVVGGGNDPIQNPLAPAPAPAAASTTGITTPTGSTNSPQGASVSPGTSVASSTAVTDNTNPLSFGIKGAASSIHHAGKTVNGIMCMIALIAFLT
ncbi:carbohydrate esterase family 4 protein [Serendipita vermifera MAFF 305830]|uniref:chitin deacetylase n=1 Tax=Serendipita vermifera MAFF 305830 TaxID=933852 RepID=A0A0C2W9C3_SERVB|nr:carbohydrate esterase family 4 protein [Serendipita vermifera MAFF 305830]